MPRKNKQLIYEFLAELPEDGSFSTQKFGVSYNFRAYEAGRLGWVEKTTVPDVKHPKFVMSAYRILPAGVKALHDFRNGIDALFNWDKPRQVVSRNGMMSAVMPIVRVYRQARAESPEATVCLIDFELLAHLEKCVEGK